MEAGTPTIVLWKEDTQMNVVEKQIAELEKAIKHYEDKANEYCKKAHQARRLLGFVRSQQADMEESFIAGG